MAAARAAADRILQAAEDAITARGRFTLALSGGRTPRILYEMLASSDYAGLIPWYGTYIFWSDERCVPPEARESNYRLAEDALLQHVPVPTSHVFRVRGELQPEAAAAAYDRVLHAFFEARLGLNAPHFDVILLGMGDDGHTASLFPGSPALDMHETWAAPSHAPNPPHGRVTLTYPALNAARSLIVLATGADKRDAVFRILSEGADLPAGRLAPTRGEQRWILDQAAAGLLEHDTALREQVDQLASAIGSEWHEDRPVSGERPDA
jgi:6-phosphogluconolactonase